MARKYLADVSIYGSLTATLDAPTKVGMLMTGAAAQSANYITIRDSSSANRMTLSASGALNTAGDITASAVGSSAGSPRIIGVTGGFGHGNAARWVFGDNANAIQNGFDNAMQIYAYHTLELIGKRVTVTPPALVGATNAGVSIINTTTTNSALWVTGSNGQTADLTTFRTFAGATAASVTADGSVTSAGASGILSRTSAAYDGISILGRAGGTGTYGVTITPGTLTASQTLTAPDVSGTIATGTGANTQVAYWSGTNTLTGSSTFTFASATGTLSANHFQVSTTAPVPTQVAGLIFWDPDQFALSYYNDITGTSLQIGKENWVRAVNTTGGTLTDGTVVIINGAQGNRPTLALADATSATIHSTLGIVTADIANNAEGNVTVFGVVRGFDTSTFAAGVPLYVDPLTPGGVTATRPIAPNHAVRIGYTLNSTNNGSILVNVDIGAALDELHDVTITTPGAGNYLRHNGTKWVNSALQAADVPLTANYVGYGSGGGGLTGSANFTYDGTNVNLGSAIGLYMGDATHASGRIRMYYNTSGGYVEMYSGIVFGAETGMITTRLQLTRGRFDLDAVDKKAEFRVTGTDTAFGIYNKTTSLLYLRFTYRETNKYDLNVPNGQILSVGGDATNPGHSFIGDTDTGMYSSGANTLNLVTGGTSRLNVLSTGEVNVSGALFGVNGVTYTWAAANAAGQLTNDGSGNLSWSAPSLTATYVGFGDASSKLTGSANMTWNDTYGGLSLSQVVGSGTIPRILLVTGAAMTALTASTEAIDVYFNLGRTVQFATGALTTQRAVYITAPTYAFVGTSTITNAYTFAISGAPGVGANATLSNARAFVVESGLSEFKGRTLFAASTASASSIRITQGSHVTSGLADGDVWCTATGFFGRTGGATIPLSRGAVGLTDAANIATDASLGTLFGVTLTASRTMSAPTNPSNGMMIMYRITQGGSGSYTITWDPVFQFSTNLPAPVLSTAVGVKDYIGFCYDSGLAKWHCVSYALGYGP